MNLLTIFAFATLSALFQDLQAPMGDQANRDVVHKEQADLGEAVEYKLDNALAEDQVTWVVIVPENIQVNTFDHDTVLIVDPPVNFTGRVRVMCRVVNFDTQEILDMNVTTNFGSSTKPKPEEKPKPDISKPSAPDNGSDIIVTDDGLMIQTKIRELSREAAPQYSGEVYGAWAKAADRLTKGVDLTEVNNTLVSDLDASVESGNTAWRKHFEIVFTLIDGKPASEAAELYQGIADGIKDKQK